MLAAVGLVVVSLIRVITGANDIDSSGALIAAIALAVPIGLAGLGGLWTERAGVVNIGLEGMMILGTWGAAFFAYTTAPWAGVLGAIIMGVIGGAIHALATVIFGVDHIVSGVAINLLGAGAGAYLATRTFTRDRRPPSRRACRQLPHLTIRPVSDAARRRRAEGGGLHLADVASVLRALSRTSPSSRSSPSCSSWSPGGCCGARPSACGCARAVSPRWRRRRSAST